jgi:hypothetical protein
VKISFVPLRESHWEWIYSRASPELTRRTKGVVALDERGTILACAVFDSWTYTSGQVHVAIANPMVLRHGFVEECMDYFFNTCERQIMIGLTPANNVKSLKFNRHLGFQEVYRVKDGYDYGVDYVVQELRKSECRWIHEQRHARSA